MNRIFNFSAGPAILPVSVLEEASKGILEYQNKGMGVIEMSHRSAPIDQLRQDSEDLVKELLNLSDDFSVLFLQGGASQQFFMVPMNLARSGSSANYISTGSWSKKAIKEAKLLGKDVHIAFSSESSNFNKIPSNDELSISPDAAYLHYTSNNTIFGTQFAETPAANGVPLIADMSSDIFCKPFDASPFGLIYAGAQKNLGPAGVTLVIIRKDMLSREQDSTPTMLRYSTHVESSSMYNTPPVFGIFVINLVLKWIKNNGGLEGMAEKNRQKAALIYKVIDENDFFIPHAQLGSRSIMNITWNLANKDLEGKFMEGAKERKLDGLKGHRSVGGFRASIYNAMPEEGCQALASYMEEFVKKHG